MLRIKGNPDAGRGVEAGSFVDGPGLIEQLQQPFQYFIQHLLTVEPVKHHCKFVAAYTESLTGALDGLLKLTGEQLQEFIAGQVA
ncbi:hypothetical protein D3C75_1277150 [compost metagenome]